MLVRPADADSEGCKFSLALNAKVILWKLIWEIQNRQRADALTSPRGLTRGFYLKVNQLADGGGWKLGEHAVQLKQMFFLHFLEQKISPCKIYLSSLSKTNSSNFLKSCLFFKFYQIHPKHPGQVPKMNTSFKSRKIIFRCASIS